MVFGPRQNSKRTRESVSINPSPKAEENGLKCPSSMSEADKRGQVPSYSTAFCSIQVPSGWDDGHPHWEGSPTWLSPPDDMLLSSGNPHTDVAENEAQSWHFVSQST